MRDRIVDLCPQARVEIGARQMDADELEGVRRDHCRENRRARLHPIIESGLDIQCNTSSLTGGPVWPRRFVSIARARRPGGAQSIRLPAASARNDGQSAPRRRRISAINSTVRSVQFSYAMRTWRFAVRAGMLAQPKLATSWRSVSICTCQLLRGSRPSSRDWIG